jgi:type II secretory pathway component PulF
MSRDAGEGGRRPGEGRRPKPRKGSEEPSAWRPNPRTPDRAPARPAVPAATISEREIERGGPGWWERIFFGRVSAGQLALFCRQFAAYLDAGVDLIKALSSLERQFGRTALGPVIGRMLLAVRRGDALGDAMAREPQAFDALFLSMIRVAEARGGVPETLRMLAHHYEARQNLIRQARSAMIYPIAVLLVAACVVALITVWLLPMFVSLLKDISGRAALPLPSRVLMAFSNFVQTLGWWLVPLLLIVGPVVIFRIYRTAAGKRVMDELALRVPVLGLLLRKLDTTRFARTLASLLGAGVDIGSSLDLTADVMQLDPMRRTLRQARRDVKEGSELSEALAGSRRFSSDVIAIIGSGEETGKLPESLEKLADDYEEQVAYMVRNMGQLIQPLLMVVLGGIVLFIILAVLLPYISIITSLSR